VRIFEAEPVTEQRYGLGEGPIWDDAQQRILWVDILVGRVLIGELDRDRVRLLDSHEFEDSVGCVFPTRDGGLLVACGYRFAVVTTDGRKLFGPHVVLDRRASRFNDGACDPTGRCLAGTLSLTKREGHENLYRLDQAGGIEVIAAGLTLSNGLAWSPNGETMYHVDSVPGVVWSLPYDGDSGNVGQRTVLLEINDGIPDGLCVDREGNLWLAIWGGGEVRCYSPAARLLARVPVPAPNTSSVAFIGAARDKLLITTASEGLTEAEITRHPDSGRLFLAEVNSSGVATHAWSGSSDALPWSPG
jgi:sugar lactone lactonase YvrE